jgi:hypothetical protein
MYMRVVLVELAMMEGQHRPSSGQILGHETAINIYIVSI